MVIRNRIKLCRRCHKMSQKELADLLGVSKNAVSSYERGEYFPSLPVAIRMCQIFDVIMEYLFYLDYSDGSPYLPFEEVSSDV